MVGLTYLVLNFFLSWISVNLRIKGFSACSKAFVFSEIKIF